ncbi:unnamed protein product, partial [Ascophyllum nodosum]
FFRLQRGDGGSFSENLLASPSKSDGFRAVQCVFASRLVLHGILLLTVLQPNSGGNRSEYVYTVYCILNKRVFENVQSAPRTQDPPCARGRWLQKPDPLPCKRVPV